MKRVACLICKSSDSERLAEYPADPYHRHLDHLANVPLTYVICRACGFVYTDPRLDEQELETLYRDKLRPSPPDPVYLKANRKVYLRRYRWAAAALDLPNEQQPSPTMLEVGCAAGVALTVFREYGWRTTGMEPADTFAGYARETFGLDVMTGFYGPGSLEGRKFDLIMFSQVLEHVPDPDALLAQACVNLNENGVLFIGVPTLMRPLHPVHPLTLQAVHLSIFSLPTLRALLGRHGFRITAHTYDSKGLLVLAGRGVVDSHEDLRDDPARVVRYFRDFIASDSRYAGNLAALKAGDKAQVRSPDHDADLSRMVVQTTPQGYLNTGERESHGTRWLYDGDPRIGAERWGDQFDASKEGVVICMGLGLGYLPLAILSRLQRGHALLICEADARIFRAAMFHQDLTALLSDERVFLVVGDDTDRLDLVLGRISKKLYVSDRLQIVRCHASVRWNRAYYARVEARVHERLKVLEINRNTIGGLGPRMFKNTLENAHLTMTMPGVSRFAGLLRGCTAIIVSAGPSLEINLHSLREAKGRAVIIACDTVLRLLVPNGIMPDVTITADPHEATYRKFRDLPMDPDAILICHPANYPDIYRTFAGRRFTTATHSALYCCLSRFWPDKGRIDLKSQSSAHQAFNFANLIGAESIIFVGQDLCYYQKKKHAGNLTKGSPFEKQESKERDKAVDILGRQVETSTLFLSFKTILEDQIRVSPARVINATEGGTGIQGTEVMTLRDAISECCTTTIDIAGRFASVAEDDHATFDAAGITSEVERLLRDAKATHKIVLRMLKYVREAARLIERGKEEGRRARSLSEQAESECTKMAGRQELMSLLVEAAYMLELYMSREDTLAIDDIPDARERFRKQIQRGVTYYTGLDQALSVFLDGAGLLLKRLHALERLTTMRPTTIRERLQLALGYKNLFDYPRAARIYREALQEDPHNRDAMFHLGEILLCCHRPHDALPLLKEVAAQAPRYRNVQRLVHECGEKAQAWAVKLAEGRQLQEQVQRDDVPLYEGEFYWRIGDRGRAARKFKEAIVALPETLEAYLDLARLHEETGELEAAVSVFGEALARIPENPLLLRELGLFSARHGQGEQAEEFLRAAVTLDHSLYEIAGDALYLAGRFLTAGEFYEQALLLQPSHNGLVMKAASAYGKARATVPVVQGKD